MTTEDNKIEVNSTVRVKNFSNKTGIIVKVKKNTVIVNINGINLECKKENVVKINSKKKKDYSKEKVRAKLKTTKKVPKLDLHGLSRIIAKERIENFISDSILKGCKSCIIIHGIGSGALADETNKVLSSLDAVKNFKKEEYNTGSVLVFL